MLTLEPEGNDAGFEEARIALGPLRCVQAVPELTPCRPLEH